MRFAWAITLVAALWGGNAVAQATIAGADDPAFVEARDAWLAGEDLPALTALSGLANDGNAAAQILLGRIAGVGYYHSHVTADMDRADRRELLRRPGGLSGKSWLTAAAETVPLAQAFLDAAGTDDLGQAVTILLDAGEVNAALIPIMKQVNYGFFEEAFALLPSEDTDLRTIWPRYLIRASLALEGKIPNNLVGALPLEAQTAHFMPSPLEILNSPADRAALIVASQNVPQLAPHRAVCAQHCPSSADLCSVVLASATTVQFHAASPTTTLIPDESYAQAPRVLDDLRRLAAPVRPAAHVVEDLDDCAADLLFPPE